MKNNCKVVVLLSFLWFFVACGSNGGQREDQKTLTFPMVSAPAMISDPQERAVYVAQHYWDKFDFTDTVLLRSAGVTEQGFANFIAILQQVPPDKMTEAMHGMMAKAEVDPVAWDSITSICEKYLYDPNSPLRNEDMYIAALNYIVASDRVDSLEKIRPQYQLTLALRNRVGDRAIDFSYTTVQGKEAKLHQLKSKYVLLYLNNPGCDACREATAQLSGNQLIIDLEQCGDLRVLALYTDTDTAAWRAHLPQMPSHWINAYDQQLTIRDQKLYDLRAIPTLYLLDAQKQVLLKDVTVDALLRYLSAEESN